MKPYQPIALLFALLLSSGATCSRAISVRDKFELSRCPGESYHLPGVAETQERRVSASHEHNGYLGECADFDQYKDLNKKIVEYNSANIYFVRLNRGETCSLDVISSNLCDDMIVRKGLLTGPIYQQVCKTYDPQKKEDSLQLAQTKAKRLADTLLAQQSISVNPTPTVEEVIGLPVDLKSWCEKIQKK